MPGSEYLAAESIPSRIVAIAAPSSRARPSPGTASSALRAAAIASDRGASKAAVSVGLATRPRDVEPVVRRARLEVGGLGPRDVLVRRHAPMVPRTRAAMGSCVTIGAMELTFLGGARTVTGSRHLVDTGRARVLIDCGMFQGNPTTRCATASRSAYDPAKIDALVLTHAHLDHCGLIPLVVAKGMRAPIFATAGTAELAPLVLLDSAKLQEEAAKRDARLERRDPGARGAQTTARRGACSRTRDEAAAVGREAPRRSATPRTCSARRPRDRDDIDGPLYTEDEVDLTLRSSAPIAYERVVRGRAGRARHALRRRTHPRVGDRPDAAPRRRRPRHGDRVLRRPRAAETPIIRDPTPISEADYVVCRVDVRRPGARAAGRGGRHARRGRSDVVADARRPARAVVRDRAHAGDRVATGPPAGREEDPAAPALSRLADGEGARRSTASSRRLRRGDAALLAARRGPLDYPGRGRRERSRSPRGSRPRRRRT